MVSYAFHHVSIRGSVESGLLTLVLRGKDLMPAGSSLVIEDLVTLHITGSSLYSQVAATLGSSSGRFQVPRPHVSFVSVAMFHIGI